MTNRKGMTIIEILIVTLIMVAVILGSVAANHGSYKAKIRKAMRMVCGANLKGMANALSVYALDYDDKYPVQGGNTNKWGAKTTSWDKPQKDWNSAGELTISSSLYLLVREVDVGVKSFICTESQETAFVNRTGYNMVELWDFGVNPSDHQSYAYQFPYGKFAANGTTKPGNAILGDRNPWFDEKLTASSIEKETESTFDDKVSIIDFLSGGKKWKFRIGNSSAHKRQGQNVLFGDGHVEFCIQPNVGTAEDNIYTIGGNTKISRKKGTSPTGILIDAANEGDSLLLNDM